MIRRLAPEVLGLSLFLGGEMQADQWYYGETGGVGVAQALFGWEMLISII